MTGGPIDIHVWAAQGPDACERFGEECQVRKAKSGKPRHLAPERAYRAQNLALERIGVVLQNQRALAHGQELRGVHVRNVAVVGGDEDDAVVASRPF